MATKAKNSGDNKHIGSSLDSLFEETGDKEETNKLAQEKIAKNSKKKKPAKKKTKAKKKKKATKKKVEKKESPVNPKISAQKELLKELGVDLDQPTESSPKPAESQGKGILKRTENNPKKTRADEMWDSIKNKPLSLFALPEKKVSEYVQRAPIVDNLLHLKLHSQAVWPPLEEIIYKHIKMPQFHEPTIEFISGYLVIGAKLKQ